MFMQAGVLEARGDLPGAIAVYEALYARDSSAPVIANNLASLLTGQNAAPDPATLDRAFAIARRLRASDVPQFRDTYGWILHLRGDSAQAMDYLVPAAEALPDNAQVQFHRAEADYALENWAAARESFERALAAVEAGSPLPPAQATAARARIAAIDARPVPEPEAGSQASSEG
jgi:tetratricopeptide (TPR) repeat protein